MGHGRRPIHSDELRLLCTGDAPGGSAPRRPLTNDADAGLRPCGRHRDDAVAGRGRPRPGRRDRAPPWPPPPRGAAGGPSPTRPRAPPAGGRPDGEPGPGGPSPTPVDAVPSAVEGAWPGGDPGTRWHPVPPLRPFPRGPSSPPGGPRPTGGPGGTGARRPRPRPSAPLGGRIVGGGGPGPLGLSAFAPGARSAWRAALGAGGARGRPRGRPARCRPWPVRCPGPGTPPRGGPGSRERGSRTFQSAPSPSRGCTGAPQGASAVPRGGSQGRRGHDPRRIPRRCAPPRGGPSRDAQYLTYRPRFAGRKLLWALVSPGGPPSAGGLGGVRPPGRDGESPTGGPVPLRRRRDVSAGARRTTYGRRRAPWAPGRPSRPPPRSGPRFPPFGGGRGGLGRGGAEGAAGGP